MAINKLSTSKGRIRGVANCASAGKEKLTVTCASGSITTGAGTRLMQTLVVGGGGGSGGGQGFSGAAGGGGAGGVICSQYKVCGSTPYSITVGAGGTGQDQARGNDGNDSDITIGSTTVTGSGGGSGGTDVTPYCTQRPGNPGGSGGAGSAYCGTAGTGIAGQGNPGGSGGCTANAGGGGGGKATAGSNAPDANNGGAGGDGITISGTYPGAPVTAVGGGGGGGAYTPAGGSTGAGGLGGGAAGGYNTGSGLAGTANTGGGAGGTTGGPSAPWTGGQGGSGIVITKELNNNRGMWPMKQQYEAVKCGAWPDGSVIQSVTLDYLVVGGGGAGKLFQGAGAGGYRASGYGPAPLQGCAVVVCSSTAYTITIGAGGASPTGTAYPICASPPSLDGPGYGNPSSFDTYITSSGGAVPLNASCGNPWNANNGERGGPGGSGSGGYASLIGGKRPGGSGNIGGFSPPEGNNGGAGGNPDNKASGGGGGATAAGSPGSGSDPGVPGGAGAPNLITGVACSAYAGGGGSGTDRGVAGLAGGTGGLGGGGTAASRNACSLAEPGAANTGGGGGGGTGGPTNFGAPTYLSPCGRSHYGSKGGSGIVVVRSPAGHPMSATPGCNTVSCVCGHTVAKFIVSGTLTLN